MIMPNQKNNNLIRTENDNLTEDLQVAIVQPTARSLNSEISNKKEQTIKRANLASKHSELEQILKNRSTLKFSEKKELHRHESDLKKIGDKSLGSTAGFITEDENGNKYMLKPFEQNLPNNPLSTKFWSYRARTDRIDAFNEYLTGKIFQKLLPGRAPDIGIVILEGDEFKDKMAIRSKFLPHAQNLSIFSGNEDGTSRINPNSSELKKLNGFEKIIAAYVLMGDRDYNGGNIMVGDDNIVFKIDHGKAFEQFSKDFSTMINNMYGKFKEKKYIDAITNSNLVFDINEFSNSLKQMLLIHEKYITDIIDSNIHELKVSGFSLDTKSQDTARKNLAEKIKKEHPELQSFEINDSVIRILGPDALHKKGDECKKKLIANIQNMKKIAKDLEIITKYSTPITSEIERLNKFKKGLWIKDFHNSSIKDPILYAIKQNWQIDGIDPIIYAANNSIKIDGQDPIFYAKNNNLKIDEQDAIMIALSNETTRSEIIANIISKEINELISCQKVSLGITNNSTIEKYFDKIIDKLQKENFIDDKIVTELKKSKTYKEHIKKTTNFIKLHSDTTLFETMLYSISELCNKMGWTKIAESLKSNIKEINLQKLESLYNVNLLEKIRLSLPQEAQSNINLTTTNPIRLH